MNSFVFVLNKFGVLITINRAMVFLMLYLVSENNKFQFLFIWYELVCKSVDLLSISKYISRVVSYGSEAYVDGRPDRWDSYKLNKTINSEYENKLTMSMKKKKSVQKDIDHFGSKQFHKNR